MFGLIPYSRNENSLWNYFDNIERSLMYFPAPKISEPIS